MAILPSSGILAEPGKITGRKQKQTRKYGRERQGERKEEREGGNEEEGSITPHNEGLKNIHGELAGAQGDQCYPSQIPETSVYVFVFNSCDKDQDQKQPGEERVYLAYAS